MISQFLTIKNKN